MRIKPSVRTGVALLALLAGLIPGTVGNAQEQQQQQPAFGASMNQPTPEEVEAYTKIATTRNADERLTLVQEYLTKYPNSPLKGRVYASAAEAYRMQNKYAQVIEYGEFAIEDSQGKDAFTMLMVADALTNSALVIHSDYKEKLARAEDYARRALEVLPELFASMQRTPGASETEAERQSKNEEYERQKQQVHGQVEGLGRAVLGTVFFRQGKYDQAVQELNQAVAIPAYRADPGDFLRLGLSHSRQQQWKEAEAALQKCIDMGGGAAAECQRHIEQVRQRLADQEKPQS